MAALSFEKLPLSPYRVLDLSDENGAFCGRLLGDLGADVIKVEKPREGADNQEEALGQGSCHAERFALNANKRGITLDLDTRDGKGLFMRLAGNADFVVESFPPGQMQKMGLSYATLSGINPRLVMTSITPFGQTGPHKDFKASDLTLMALGGLAYITGDSDRPPLRISVDQSHLQAGVHAAGATLIAHYHRLSSGEGQHVDVSVHEAIVSCVYTLTTIYWELERKILQRQGTRTSYGQGGFARLLWECKDGHVSWRIRTVQQADSMRALIAWMNSEGIGFSLRDVDWEELDFASLPQERLDTWEAAFAEFFGTKTKRELYLEAVKRNIILFPVNTVADLLHDEQLQARDSWVQVFHPEIGKYLSYPEAPFKSSEFAYTVRRRAPVPGEHNEEILGGELGLSEEQILGLKEAGIV